MKKVLSLLLAAILALSLLAGCDSGNAKKVKISSDDIDLGKVTSETPGNTETPELKFKSEKEMLASMKKAASGEKFELYYSPDNMTVALKDKASGKLMLSNPYNAALDANYSGVIGEKLASQIVLSYLEKETKIVDMYSSTECADKGQYSIKTYENGLSFDLVFGTDSSAGAFLTVLSADTYKDLSGKVSSDSNDILEAYYTFYKKDELEDSGIFDIYPDLTAQDVYYCDFELNDRDKSKLSGVFKEAGYTTAQLKAETEKLDLGESTVSEPYFKLTLQYLLTDTGVTVSIPNKSIEYNPDFPLLRISVLPYFGADVPGKDAEGYLFIPDGSGTVINMNREEPNRRIIMTGKVYGENSSRLPKKTAEEKTEQYYLPVFGTVRNNKTALFGIIESGDANCEITSLLGRPNGNYYTVNPEFIIADYEQYTRISVVSNAWSNKTLYLYDKNTAGSDLTVRYHFLKGNKANYSHMAKVYGDYLFGGVGSDNKKPVLNLKTIGSALVKETFLGFSYDTEAVFTGYDDNIEIIRQLKKNNAENVSLTLKGWQKNGLDTAISGEIRVSSALGGKSALKNLADYCKKEKIPFSLYNDISFVGFDKSFDGFKPKSDAARTLELKYAKEANLSPDTMLYDDGKYVVKPSSYNRLLEGLSGDVGEYPATTLNMGALGYSLNADYTKNDGINRGQALSYIKQALKNNNKTKLSFDKGNAYVLPYAKEISDISVSNSGLPGETAAVPFIQMVLGGKVPYSSQPINLEENIRGVLLKCIESGTTPTFLLSYKNTSALKQTKYTDYYSIDYEILKKTVLESYGYVDRVVTATGGTSVIKHVILADGVTVSTYANGIRVYVNNTDKPYTAGGITVKANDYLIKG